MFANGHLEPEHVAVLRGVALDHAKRGVDEAQVVFPDNTCRASATSTTTQSCVDTLPGGPFLVGPTFGFIYELGSSSLTSLGLDYRF